MKKLFLALALVSFQVAAHADPILVTNRLLSSDLKVPGEAVIVEYFSRSCGVCRLETPILHDLAIEFSGKVKIIKVESSYLLGGGQINSYPEFHFYTVDGQESVHNGAPTYNSLANWIQNSGT